MIGEQKRSTGRRQGGDWGLQSVEGVESQSEGEQKGDWNELDSEEERVEDGDEEDRGEER